MAGWLIFQSAEAGIIIRNGLVHEFTCSRGDSLQGFIELENPGTESQEVRIYQTDYQFDADGKVFYPDPGSTPRSNAQWIEYYPQNLILPPKEKTIISLKIKIPWADSLAGTYWSMVMVEAPKAGESVAKEGMVSIKSVIRYGVQIITDLTEKGDALLKFNNVKIVSAESRKQLSLDVENVGNRQVTPNVMLKIFKPDGQSLDLAAKNRKRLFPGTSWRFDIELKDLPAGEYQSLLTADCGDKIFGMNLSLILK
ncbi:MAG: hypothetical protein ONB24_13705 [candidate division KSB1 bacterium]|nr:hypothetical protein [candidate division KSB1 bacterium]